MATRAVVKGLKEKELPEGILGDILRLIGVGEAPDPSDLMSPLSMAKIPARALHAAINSRERLFHGTYGKTFVGKPVTDILDQGIIPSRQGSVSLSRDPHAARSFGPFIFEVDPNKLKGKTKPIDATKFNNKPRRFSEERISKVPTTAIENILIDTGSLNNMMEDPEQSREVIDTLMDLISKAKNQNINITPFNSSYELRHYKSTKGK